MKVKGTYKEQQGQLIIRQFPATTIPSTGFQVPIASVPEFTAIGDPSDMPDMDYLAIPPPATGPGTPQPTGDSVPNVQSTSEGGGDGSPNFPSDLDFWEFS